MAIFQVVLEGTEPYIMSSDNAVDLEIPMSRELKAINRKRNKNEEDEQKVQHLTFLLACYTDEGGNVCVPGENLESCLREAGKMSRQKALVDRGLWVLDLNIPLVFEGPKTPEGLWKDKEFHDRRVKKISQGRKASTLPKFPRGWKLKFRVLVDDNQLSEEQFRGIVETAGKYAGLGALRPRYGRFTAKVTLEV